MKSFRLVWFTILAILTNSTPFLGHSQEAGIRFSDGLSWSDILTKAKADRKYIFMDCYTTWCGPCKHMSMEIFTQKIVGDFFNANFINISVQMDRTPKDQETIKAWYSEADSISSKVGVNAYPTFLIFSPEGEVVDRFNGTLGASEFIARAQQGLKPAKQYYKIIDNDMNHLSDSIFLHDALNMALTENDNLTAAKIGDQYLATLRDPFSRDNLMFLMRINMGCSSDLFQFFLVNVKRIDEILGSEDQRGGRIENMLCYHIRNEQVEPLFISDDTIVKYKNVLRHLQNKYPLLANTLPFWVEGCFKHFIGKKISGLIYKESVHEPSWEVIARKMSNRYPGFDCTRLVSESKPGYYKNKKKWSQCEKSALVLLDHYGDHMDAQEINNLVWYYLFMYSTNPRILRTALKWSKRSVDMDPGDCGHIDTYANLLYKTHDQKDAIGWEKKALEQCGSDDGIRSNFEKMNNGQKTWEE